MQRLDTARIRDALFRLRSRELRVSGSDVHRFRLNPSVADDEVCTFERIHNVTLPSDYRDFLTGVGNGGAGPFYGVFPLGEMDDGFGLRRWQENDGVIGVLAEPFPHETEWNDLSAMPSDDPAACDSAEYEKQMEAFDSTYWQSSLMNGALPICHEGCGLRVWLVVTGAQAGHLWEDRRSEYAGIRPVRLTDGSSATFWRWYDEWLRVAEAADE